MPIAIFLGVVTLVAYTNVGSIVFQ